MTKGSNLWRSASPNLSTNKIPTRAKWALPILMVAILVAIGSGKARPLSNEQGAACTDATLAGQYQWHAAGYIQTTSSNGGNIADFAPVAEASSTVFDGQGNVTSLVSTDNFSSGGSFVVTGNGTYSVNSDCTATVTWNTSLGPLSRHLVINRGENTAEFVNTDPGVIVAGTMKKTANVR
jgi:hypothetical protein